MNLSRPQCSGDEGLPGAKLSLDLAWLPRVQADALFETLRREIPWETHRIRMFGREVDSPRLSCWIGDEDAAYAYSGTRFEPRPWPASLLAVRQRLSHELETGFDSVLANLYRSGRDAMGWHSDDERELGSEPVIASLSLGAARRFVLKSRDDVRLKREFLLPHGSLLVMAGQTQRHCRHCLPRTARPVGERINLTFRRVLA